MDGLFISRAAAAKRSMPQPAREADGGGLAGARRASASRFSIVLQRRAGGSREAAVACPAAGSEA
ncbi:hypothetical protein ACS0X5_06465, partial [Burkholderia gladioli]|uniref:hypothetical protein n=1 Tax=Burkholderia gladioli TaxID=28095 RepID=UPI003F7B2DA6